MSKDKGERTRYICPSCGALFIRESDDPEKRKSFPFCSPRCKMADLDMWFTEDYRISRPIDPDDLEEEEAGSGY